MGQSRLSTINWGATWRYVKFQRDVSDVFPQVHIIPITGWTSPVTPMTPSPGSSKMDLPSGYHPLKIRGDSITNSKIPMTKQTIPVESGLETQYPRYVCGIEVPNDYFPLFVAIGCRWRYHGLEIRWLIPWGVASPLDWATLCSWLPWQC